MGVQCIGKLCLWSVKGTEIKTQLVLFGGHNLTGRQTLCTPAILMQSTRGSAVGKVKLYGS